MCAIMEDVLLTESTISGIDVSAKVSDCAITVSRDASRGVVSLLRFS